MMQRFAFPRCVAAVFLFLVVGALTVFGDTVKLKDGTSIEGRVIDQGDKYWIKDTNGDSHLIDKSKVLTWTKGSGGSAASTPPPTAGSPPTPTYTGSGNFTTIKTRADAVDSAMAAVGIWQAYIDSKPAAADLTAATAELKHWQDVVSGEGEKVNGKWVWGDEREKLLDRVRALMRDGSEAIESSQTLVGIQKLEEAVRLYPNNFEANFALGYFNLLKGVEAGRNNAKLDAGIKAMELAVKLRPESAPALSDLSIAYNFKGRYQAAVEMAYKAVKIEDSKGTVQNLVNTIAYAPPGMQNNSSVKPIMSEAMLLAGKYGISPSRSADWVWIRPDDEKVARAKRHSSDDEEEGKDGPPGPMGDGTGFFISSTGHILTNRHVAKPGDYLMVRMSDKSLRLAQRLVIDDEQDMAVLKIDVADPVPFVRLASYSHPATGADVAVFGFPLLFDYFSVNSSVKMTRGIVTAWDPDNKLCDVTVDAIVNPGNSGGPMVDHHGNLLALTAMKTVAASGEITTYGLGYSTERIQKFFKKQKDKLRDANLETGKDDLPVLSNEELATRLTPCTVCIFPCRGKPPVVGSDGLIKSMTKPK